MLLLLGKKGQLGFELERLMQCEYKVVACDVEEVDFSSGDSIRKLVAKVKPRVIINAAAYTAVDKSESEPELVMAINATAPGILAEEAKRLGAYLVHYSTDYVYDGSIKGAHREDETPNPVSVYGKSKLAGDLAIQAVGGLHLILRTSWVYGSRGKNFLLTMLKAQGERESVQVVDDQIGSPTWCHELAKATDLMLKKALIEQITGLYHIAGGGSTSWCGFTKEIFSIAGSDCRVHPISTEQYPTAAKRPKNSVLDQSKLKKDFGLVMPDWKHSLSECMKELNIFEGTRN